MRRRRCFRIRLDLPFDKAGVAAACCLHCVSAAQRISPGQWVKQRVPGAWLIEFEKSPPMFADDEYGRLDIAKVDDIDENELPTDTVLDDGPITDALWTITDDWIRKAG